MRRTTASVFAILLLLMLAGCIRQQSVNPNQFEGIEQSQILDVDSDGENDVFAYTFTPVRMPEAGIQVRRTLLAYRQVDLEYPAYKTLTDYDVLSLSQTLEDFQQNAESSNQQCLQRIGLTGVNCIDARTCAKLCAGSSAACKRMAEDHETVVGETVLRYAQHSTQLDDALYQSLRTTGTLIDMERSDRAYLANKLESVLNELYANEASPLVQNSPVTLCTPGEYSFSKWKQFLDGVGTHHLETQQYNYVVLLEISSLPQANRTFSQSELVLHDRLPEAFLERDSVVSPLPVLSDVNGSFVEISFEPIQKRGDKKELFSYSFSSLSPPSDWLGELRSPRLSMQVLDLQALSASAYLFEKLGVTTGNAYVAFGLALAIPVVGVIFVLFLLGLLAGTLQAVLAREKAVTGFRRSLGRTTIRWKTDLILSLLLLVGGFAASFYFAPKVRLPMDIFGMGEFILTEPTGFVASTAVFFGAVLFYLAVENRVRVTAIEDAYGRETRDDRDLFASNVKELKEQLKVLEKMVGEAGKENLDVSSEYDVLASISMERLDSMAKKFDDNSKRTVQDELIKVNEAVERLRDKRKSSEENWAQWKGIIEKLVEENEEVHASQLLTVPASLRIWALDKFAREVGKDIVLEGKILKRKKVSPERMVQSLFDQQLVRGIIASKNDKIVLNKIETGSPAVAAALALKLLGYIRTTTRSFGYGNYSGFAAVGSQLVLVVSKEQGMETVLLVPREKFKDALLAWREKAKYFA